MNRRRAFTLVELLVVIAIIGILVALLLPAVQAAREAARRLQCSKNLKQVALGLLNYHEQLGRFPPALLYDEASGADPSRITTYGANWVIMLLPFIEQQGLHDSLNLNVPISHADNRLMRGAVLPGFSCPSDTGHDVKFAGTLSGEGDNWARGNYAANGGNGPLIRRNFSAEIWGKDSPGWQDSRCRGVMGPNVSLKIAEITDGTTNTILVGELRVGLTSLDRRGVWAMGTAGASALFWYGSTGDANGPNACFPNSDDIAGCPKLDQEMLLKECMTCAPYDESDQATTRSQHQDGVQLAFADGSVHFISNYIETSGSYGAWGTVWDFMIASADGEPVDAGKVGP